MPQSLSFQDLTLGYDRHPVVHHLEGTIAQGDLLAVCGPNGAGKSTLLKGIAGIISPLGGSILRNSIKPRDIAYLPQASEIDRTFPISVFDMVAMGLWPRRGIFGLIGKRDHASIEKAIASVGLTGFEERALDTLSGGQMQRLLFARLILQDAKIILLDEPFTAIDTKTTADLLALIADWHGEGRTLVAVLHDMEVVRAHFPKTLLMAREAIAWGPTNETLSAKNLLSARAMIEAFDRDAALCDTDRQAA